MNIKYYKKLQKQVVKTLLQVLVWVLIFNFSFPLLWAQQQRRGVFLQDQLSEGSSNFDGPEGDMGDDEIGFPGMRGRTGRLGPREMFGQTGSYQVHVLGEVGKPGTYQVSPSMRVTDALLRARGIASNGSERFVELRKSGQKRGRIIDLFAYKTYGKLSQNPYLQNNDTIFVPLRMSAVEIEGPVRRPGIFEIKNENNLEDIVELAGGFTVGMAKTEPVKVIRYGGLDKKEIHEVPNNPRDLRSFEIRDGDFIVVPHKFLTDHKFDYNIRKLPNDNIFYPSFESRVFVIGAVKAPGAFPFNQHYTLRQYLTVAGGTTTLAKRGKIKVVNVEGETFKAKNADYDELINPGDTIVVPEKSVPTSFYIGLLPTIASIGLSAAALFR